MFSQAYIKNKQIWWRSYNSCEYTENYFKWINCVVRELYLNKAAIQKINKWIHEWSQSCDSVSEEGHKLEAR